MGCGCHGGSCKLRGCGRPQMGTPINDATLAMMSEEERDFWKSFLQEATAFLRQQCEDEKPIPFDNPPRSLVEKYQTALAKYDGRKYHDFRSMAIVINFPPVNQFAAAD